MNNTKLKSLLLKGIIDSDFLFLNQKSGKQLSHTKFHSKHKQVDITSLNLFETLKSLKQLVRSLKFIADTDNKILHIWLQNKQYLYILDLLLNKIVWDVDLSIKNSLVRNSSNKLKTQLLFLLDFPLKNNKKNIKRIFNEHIFLINKVNLKLEKNNWGSYKLYNNLENFKKFLFLFIIIDLVLNNKK
jgi:hypothetical protein|tara:strand:- start:749 stop:1309 length:561 start_codon:yes stop_codon:yes gene_type:complete